jgi:hypothetical protein
MLELRFLIMGIIALAAGGYFYLIEPVRIERAALKHGNVDADGTPLYAEGKHPHKNRVGAVVLLTSGLGMCGKFALELLSYMPDYAAQHP